MNAPNYDKINNEIIRKEFPHNISGDYTWIEIVDDFIDDEGTWIVPDGEIEGETGEFEDDGHWIYY